MKLLMFLFSNQPSQETDLIRPDLTGGKTSVQRSISSPSIWVEVGQSSTRIELDLAGGGRSARCGTIAETQEDRDELSPAPVPRTRAATIITFPSKLPKSAPIPPPARDRGGGVAISPQFRFLHLY